MADQPQFYKPPDQAPASAPADGPGRIRYADMTRDGKHWSDRASGSGLAGCAFTICTVSLVGASEAPFTAICGALLGLLFMLCGIYARLGVLAELEIQKRERQIREGQDRMEESP